MLSFVFVCKMNTLRLYCDKSFTLGQVNKHVCGQHHTTLPCPVISGWIEAHSKALLCEDQKL